MDYMASLHFIDFISWSVMDNGPLYCITLWPGPLTFGSLWDQDKKIEYLSSTFLLTNRKCPDNILSVGTFPIAQQEISLHSKSVGTFPIGVVGTFLVGCVGISTASVSGHFYRPVLKCYIYLSSSFCLEKSQPPRRGDLIRQREGPILYCLALHI
jgi:hypothetical protein